MFKRILIPTDGSKVSARASRDALALARDMGASIVAYYAVEPIERRYYSEGASGRVASVKAIHASLREQGRRHLEDLRKAAQGAGVACETVMTTPATPSQGIVEVARRKKCDAIFMASHGRGTLGSLLLGSVTQKVLAQTRLPVLVYR